MAASERRRSMPLPGSPNTEINFRNATDAMQKAADAMVAATESFRRQFHQHEGLDGYSEVDGRSHQQDSSKHRLPSYRPYRPIEEAAPARSESAAGSSGSTSGNLPTRASGPSPTAQQEDVAPISRNPYSLYRAARVSSRSPPSTPIPAHVPMSDFLPDLSRDTKDDAGIAIAISFSNDQAGGDDGTRLSPEKQQHEYAGPVIASETRPMSEQDNWPVPPTFKDANPTYTNTASRWTTPLSYPAAALYSSINTRQPSIPHADLDHAAKLKKVHSFQGAAHAGQVLPGDAAETPITPGGADTYGGIHDIGDLEPEPILQIGRYTYVRSTNDEFQMSLIRDDGSRRYTTIPLGRGGSLRIEKSRKKKTPGPHGFSLFREALFVLLICLSQVLMLAGIAQALVPAKIMGESFPDTTPGDLAWYSAAYGLTAGTFVLPAGRLGDLFGHRRVFTIGFVWFAIWSLLTGFSGAIQESRQSGGTIFFIISRAMQGIGPAMLVPNGQAMLGRAYKPGPRKNLVMCLFGAAAPLGFVIGAVMSSLFAVRASWPWAFWTMAAVCLALGAVSMLILPADAPKDSGKATPTDDEDDLVVDKDKKKAESLWVRMDATGMILGVASLVLINFAFNQAPIVGWDTPYTYFLLLIGLLFMGAFAYIEAVQAPYPLVPFAAMGAMTNFVLGCTGAGWGCFSVWVYYSVSIMENLRGWSPLLTSAAYAPAPVSGLVASLLTGYLFSRGVKPHWVMLISMCAFFVGSLLFVTGPPEQLYWFNAFFSILIMPFGMDMSNPAATILLSNSVSKEHQGIAASLVVTVVNYSISLALGIAGSAEAGVFDENDLLVGYRAAQYFGLGLGALGIILAAAFLAQSYVRAPPAPAAPMPGPQGKNER